MKQPRQRKSRLYHIVNRYAWGGQPRWIERLMLVKPNTKCYYIHKDVKHHCVELITGEVTSTNLNLQEAVYYATHHWPLLEAFKTGDPEAHPEMERKREIIASQQRQIEQLTKRMNRIHAILKQFPPPTMEVEQQEQQQEQQKG